MTPGPAERYRLDRLLAVGGMGEVWRAEDVVLARPVPVKTLRPAFTGDQEFRRRFRGEDKGRGEDKDGLRT